jgi:transcriptional regulator with XRE-family HTH domain
MDLFRFNFPVHQDLPKRLIELRKAEGLTQVQVAEKLGITQGSYAHYERGFRRVPLEMIPKIAAAIGANEVELFGFESPKGKRGPHSELDKRFEKIRTLPKKEQELAISMLDRIINAAS